MEHVSSYRQSCRKGQCVQNLPLGIQLYISAYVSAISRNWARFWYSSLALMLKLWTNIRHAVNAKWLAPFSIASKGDNVLDFFKQNLFHKAHIVMSLFYFCWDRFIIVKSVLFTLEYWNSMKVVLKVQKWFILQYNKDYNHRQSVLYFWKFYYLNFRLHLFCRTMNQSTISLLYLLLQFWHAFVQQGISIVNIFPIRATQYFFQEVTFWIENKIVY